MQKHKFGVTSSEALFMKTAPGPPEHEKLCVDILRPGRIGMHYLTHISYWMQKDKFVVTSPDRLFMETAPGPPKHEK
jgi:hypothetical protein